MRTFAVIPAGGKGMRAGNNIPKQYLKFSGKELIVYTLDVFQKSNLIDEIVIAADPAYFKKLQALKVKYKLNKISMIVPGGAERQDSVFNALSSLPAKKNDLVLVHDAARPLITEQIIADTVNTARKKGNAIVCIKAKDTLLRKNGAELTFPERENVFYVQTPQAAKFAILMDAFNKAGSDCFKATDESMLLKYAGNEINIVEGSILNFKITTAGDAEIFRKIAKKVS
jgi:2-C-methyl-D-erythritol 4-phosphate cytidylyltransferase